METWYVPLIKWSGGEVLGPVIENSSFSWTQLSKSLPRLFLQDGTRPVPEILCSTCNCRRVIFSSTAVCDDNLKYWNMFLLFLLLFFCRFFCTLVAEEWIQQNSINPTHVGPHKCQIIKYSGLSDGIYTDLSSYRWFFCYCSYAWTAKLIRGVFSLDISFIGWFRDIRVFFCVFWSFHSRRGWWSRRHVTTTDAQTLLEDFLNTSLVSDCFIDEAFLW